MKHDDTSKFRSKVESCIGSKKTFKSDRLCVEQCKSFSTLYPASCASWARIIDSKELVCKNSQTALKLQKHLFLDQHSIGYL